MKADKVFEQVLRQKLRVLPDKGIDEEERWVREGEVVEGRESI